MDELQKERRNAETLRRIRDMPDPITMMQVQASLVPEKQAFIHVRDADDLSPRTYSCAQAAEAMARLAAALQSVGIGPDDTVAIVAPSIPETLLAIGGAATVATAFPLNLLLSPEAMANQLRLAGARAIISLGKHPAMPLDTTVAQAIRLADIDIVVEIDTGHGRSDALLHSGARPFTWDSFLESGNPATVTPRTGKRTAFLFHTGGTTGAPKLAELSMDAVMASVHASAVGLD
jgi:fatty-acyl-CoA synthase